MTRHKWKIIGLAILLTIILVRLYVLNDAETDQVTFDKAYNPVVAALLTPFSEGNELCTEYYSSAIIVNR